MQLSDVQSKIEYAIYTYDPLNNQYVEVTFRQTGGVVCADIALKIQSDLEHEDIVGIQSDLEDHMMDPTNYNGLTDFSAHITGLDQRYDSILLKMIFIDAKDDHDEEHHSNIVP